MYCTVLNSVLYYALIRNMSITLFALSLSITVIIALHPFSFVLLWQEAGGRRRERRRDEEREVRFEYWESLELSYALKTG